MILTCLLVTMFLQVQNVPVGVWHCLSKVQLSSVIGAMASIVKLTKRHSVGCICHRGNSKCIFENKY